jgi:hypothetical protein
MAERHDRREEGSASEGRDEEASGTRWDVINPRCCIHTPVDAIIHLICCAACWSRVPAATPPNVAAATGTARHIIM